MEDTHPFAKLELTPSELNWLKEAQAAIKMSLSTNRLTEIMHSDLDDSPVEPGLLHYATLEVEGAVTKLTSLHVYEFVKRQRMDLEVRLSISYECRINAQSLARDKLTFSDTPQQPFSGNVYVRQLPEPTASTVIRLYYRHTL